MSQSIKLSDAIRAGAIGATQIKGGYIELPSSGLRVNDSNIAQSYICDFQPVYRHCCALGAAMFGGANIDEWRLLAVPSIDVHAQIIKMNDEGSSFDEIIAWLEREYPNLEVPSWKE